MAISLVPLRKRLNDLFKVMGLVSVDGAHTQSQAALFSTAY